MTLNILLCLSGEPFSTQCNIQKKLIRVYDIFFNVFLYGIVLPHTVYLSRGNLKQRNQMFDIIRSEYSMLDTAYNRDPDACVVKTCIVKDADSYVVGVTGASVTADSSISLIHKYCEKLPRDKYENVVFLILSLIISRIW